METEVYIIHQPGITYSSSNGLLATPRGFALSDFSFVVILTMCIGTENSGLLFLIAEEARQKGQG